MQIIVLTFLICLGPFGVNGVPLRRVNQAYVIATSQKIDVAGVNAAKFDDKYFAKPKAAKKGKKSAAAFLGKKEKKEKKEGDKKDVSVQSLFSIINIIWFCEDAYLRFVFIEEEEAR